MPLDKAHIVSRLQTDILRLQGHKPFSHGAADLGLGPVSRAFPNATFPVGAVHEFLPASPRDAAATRGFMAGLLSSLAGGSGVVLWVGARRQVFPPALISFGIAPERVIFVDVSGDKEAGWVMEEALKCEALTAVVGEMTAIDFTFSRRLQLAVEHSQVTGFVLRPYSRKLNITACVSRWQITSLPGERVDDLPGLGYPMWRVELLRVRNGKPGVWEVGWFQGKFRHEETKLTPLGEGQEERRKTG